ncbi:MAG: phage terminase large subunit, partial [Anaerotignum sp.]|nr:phage terminase large subunit [Anaerotignum sp.]
MRRQEIRLTHCIGEGFYELHRDIRKGAHSHYWLKGGRGSGKSSFISIEILLGIIEDENANAVVIRKVAANLKDSVFEQMNWAIRTLGVEDEWEKKMS